MCGDSILYCDQKEKRIKQPRDEREKNMFFLIIVYEGYRS
jgi:hypothetical protein